VIIARVVLLLLVAYALVVLIIMINMLIATVADKLKEVKQAEEAELLRNRAIMIVEMEHTITEAERKQLNSRLIQRYMHVLKPQKQGDEAELGLYLHWHARKRVRDKQLTSQMDSVQVCCTTSAQFASSYA
jgi:hypothetical protein